MPLKCADDVSALLERLLPFSEPAESCGVHIIAADLARTLGITEHIALRHCSASAALRAESYFRRRWWTGIEDPFRDAIHVRKARMHTCARARPEFTAAWRESSSCVQSVLWREHARQLHDGAGTVERSYYLRAVRFAQQLWTRAARWNVAFESEPNPFLFIASLLVNSVWPIGVFRDSFHMVTLDAMGDQDRTGSFGYPARGSIARVVRGRAFLVGPFDQAFTGTVLNELTRRGWTVEHGRVDEAVPPEQQIAQRIMQAQLVVAAVEQMDPDFGLPWWTFQEIDFAVACGRPVAIIAGSQYPETLDDFPTFRAGKGKIEEAFWKWLNGVV